MIYFIRAEGTPFVKIGFTSGPVEKRVAALQTGSPHRLVVESTLERGTLEHEEHLHALFSDAHTGGEWFELDRDDVHSVTLFWAATVLDGPIDAHGNELRKVLKAAQTDPGSWCSSWKTAREALGRVMWSREAVSLVAASGFSVARICQRLYLNGWLSGTDGWLKPVHVDLAIRAIESARPMGVA